MFLQFSLRLLFNKVLDITIFYLDLVPHEIIPDFPKKRLLIQQEVERIKKSFTSHFFEIENESLMELFRAQIRPEAKARVASSFARLVNLRTGEWIRETLKVSSEKPVRMALLQSLARQPRDPANVPFLIEGLRDAEDDVARSITAGLLVHRPAITRELAQICLERASLSLSLVHPIERLLVTLADRQRSGYRVDTDLNTRPEDVVRDSMIVYWRSWYQERFGQPFSFDASRSARERSDDDVSRFLRAESSRGGTAARGAKIYEQLQCRNCHGGGIPPGKEERLFGPDLIGVAQRLSRVELAEALIFPSRHVSDRFKAFELEKKDGTIATGFLTEQSDDGVTFASQQRVERVSRQQIARLTPQANSLMPDGLLNKLSDDDLRDLLAYLEIQGTPQPKP